MFRPTLPRPFAMVSTHGGMRRILKNRAGGGDGVLRYMRQAVESGTYRTTDEIHDMLRARARASGLSAVDLNQPDFEQDDGSGLDDVKSVMRRFRMDIVRGASVVDYPSEYLILRQYPPFPNPPRTPAKELRRMERQGQENAQRAMQPLVEKYLKKQQQQKKKHSQDDDGSADSTTNESSTTDDYYRRLLGVPAPPATTLLGQRTAAVQKAYAAAMAHIQLERASGAALSDAEISKQVDELLAKAQKEHAHASREMTERVQQWRRQQEQQQEQDSATTTDKSSSSSSSSTASSSSFSDSAGDATTTSKTAASSTISASSSGSTTVTSLLGNDTTKVHAMLTWSRRLQAVPYRQWTVGASTALDHWIARQVLDLQEATWQSLLEADDNDNADNDSDVDLMELGRQIVAVRESLFPETLLESDLSSSSLQDEYSDHHDDDDMESSDKDSSSSRDSVEKSIEELLASLGSMSASSSRTSTNLDKKKEKETTPLFETSPAIMDDDQRNTALDDWTHRLQDWRRRCRTDSTSFDEWSTDEKDEFRAFVREYASITHTTTTRIGGGGSAAARNMNLFSKREDEDDDLLQVLLSHPPVNKVESDAFWNALQTKQEASALLDSLRAAVEDGTSDNNKDIAAALSLVDFFIGPPDIVFKGDDNSSEQLDRLLNLGALRPLLDEYVSEEERMDFWKRHGDVIFANVPLDHLIPVDPDDDDADDDSMTDSDSDWSSSSRVITGRDLEGTPLSRDLHMTLSPQSRFLLKTMPFREDASSLLQAWNEHKSSRARYEEELFQTGRLGLRYSEQGGKDES